MRSLKESILSSNNAGIVDKVKDNLKTGDDITEFSKLWSALGLDVKGFHWGKYAGRGSYAYFSDNLKQCLIYCTKDMIVIYNDEPELWYNNKEFKDYCNKASDVLKMKKHLSRTQIGENCIFNI